MSYQFSRASILLVLAGALLPLWKQTASANFESRAEISHSTQEQIKQEQDTHAIPTLISSSQSLIRGSNQLAISFTIEEHWHLYYDGQNDTGQPPVLKINLPPGVAISPLQFPPPQRLIQSDSVLDHIYEKSLTLPFTLTISEDFKGDSLTLEGSLNWLECSDVCKFGKGTVSKTLPVMPKGGATKPSENAAAIAAAVKAIPAAAPNDLAKIEFLPTDKPERVVISVPGATGLTFTPDNTCSTIGNLLTGGESKGGTLRLTFEEAKTDNVLSGLIQVRNGSESRWYHLSKPVVNSAGPKSVPASAPVAPAPSSGGR
jgi:DsbC/DsbD-like thiol-disulfide interchange protein